MLTEIDLQEANGWVAEQKKVENWNDFAKLKLYMRAANIIPLLLKEIDVLNERLKIRSGK